MIEAGKGLGSLKFDEVGERMLAVIGAAERNKMRVIRGTTDGLLNVSIANETERMEIEPYKAWRVIGLGVFWIIASTANEDPIIDFGYSGDDDAFGKMTSAITGGEKFNIGDHQKYDPLNLLTPEVIAEASATLAITWTPGVKFGVWQKSLFDTWCREAAVAGITTGYVRPYMVVEIDTGGKW